MSWLAAPTTLLLDLRTAASYYAPIIKSCERVTRWTRNHLNLNWLCPKFLRSLLLCFYTSALEDWSHKSLRSITEAIFDRLCPIATLLLEHQQCEFFGRPLTLWFNFSWYRSLMSHLRSPNNTDIEWLPLAGPSVRVSRRFCDIFPSATIRRLAPPKLTSKSYGCCILNRSLSTNLPSADSLPPLLSLPPWDSRSSWNVRQSRDSSWAL